MTGGRARALEHARSLVRLGEVMGVAAATSVSLVVVALRTSGRPDDRSRRMGVVVSRALTHLGPAFVKVGQLLSTRQDVFSPGVCAELQRALALGRPSDETGGDARSHEIGSIARVEREVIDGVDVAVKTVRPRTAARLDRDLTMLTLLVDLVTSALARSGPPLPRVVDEVCASVRRQTDLEAEARTLTRLGALQATLPVCVPRVVAERSDREHLVMTWLPGQASGRHFAQERAVAKKLVLAVYEMLFITGVVHCDLHPGNWWELPDGRLAIVDAGFSYELDDEMRCHFAEFFLGMASNNSEVCSTHALAASATPVTPDREAAFRRDMEELIASTTGMTAGDFSLAGFAARFFAIQRRHGAFSKPEFIFPFMALLAIEGQVKALDPTINFQALAGRVVLRAIVNRSRTGSSDRTAPGTTVPR